MLILASFTLNRGAFQKHSKLSKRDDREWDDPTGRDASWAIVGISLERAIEIGRHWFQHAIFEVLNGEAFVVG